MKEELQKEGLSFIKEEIAEIKSSLKERMKLPVLVAYCIILIIYNWDVLFYFVLESGTATVKIDHIKTTFTNDRYHRYLCPLLFATISTFIFPVIQVGINYVFNWFKKQNYRLIKAEDAEKTEHEKNLIDLRSSNKERDVLLDELNNKKDEILVLKSQITHLEKSNIDLVQSEKDLNEVIINEQESIDALVSENQDLVELFKSFADQKYASKKFNYFSFFYQFYNYFISKNDNEKRFIKRIFKKMNLDKNYSIEFTETEDIDIFDLVDAEQIFKDFETIGIIDHSDIELQIRLNNKGKEVLNSFKMIEDIHMP